MLKLSKRKLDTIFLRKKNWGYCPLCFYWLVYVFSTSLSTVRFHSILNLALLGVNLIHLTISTSKCCEGLPSDSFLFLSSHSTIEPCNI